MKPTEKGSSNKEVNVVKRRFYEPKMEDVVVVLPGQRWVSLAALEAAGIETGSPFLVWPDRATNTVNARQSAEMRAANPGRLFEGVRPITGTPGDEESEYCRGFDDGHERGFEEGRDSADEEEAVA